MDRETVAHDGDELRVNLVLVLLKVLQGIKGLQGSQQKCESLGEEGETDALELVELDQHDGLLGTEMSPNGLSDVGDEGDHDRERLRGQSCSDAGEEQVSLESTCKESQPDVPRCFAVMFLRPAERMAPAPRTT